MSIVSIQSTIPTMLAAKKVCRHRKEKTDIAHWPGTTPTKAETATLQMDGRRGRWSVALGRSAYVVPVRPEPLDQL